MKSDNGGGRERFPFEQENRTKHTAKTSVEGFRIQRPGPNLTENLSHEFKIFWKEWVEMSTFRCQMF